MQNNAEEYENNFTISSRVTEGKDERKLKYFFAYSRKSRICYMTQ